MPSHSPVRLQAFALIVLAALLVLVGRLWMLQLTRWVVYARAAEGNSTSITYTPAPRGLIYDRNGNVLAENRPIWNVSIAPAKFPRDEGEAERIIVRLAGILKVPTPEIRKSLQEARQRRGKEVAVLEGPGEDIDFKAVAQIMEQALPGVGILQSAVRSYPHGSLAAHVLGYARGINDVQYESVKPLNYPVLQPPTATPSTGEMGEPEPLYSRESVFGQSGLEKQYEIDLNLAPPLPILCGRRGKTVYEVDSSLAPVRLIEQRPPAVGASLYLTLNLKAQEAAENALRTAIQGHSSRTGAAVVVDVNDGGILALASLPSYNPNDLVKRIPAARWRALNDDPRKPLFCKATQGLYPPASTFKLISMAAALDKLKVRPEKTFFCPGYIREGGLKFGCWEERGHGALDLRAALARSCDVYFYELIRKMGLTSDDLYEYATDFGLGEKSGIDLPAEESGMVPNREWKLKTKGEQWWNGNSLNMVIGQGATQATPLQMALVCAAVANGGALLQPHLVKQIDWPQHLNLPPRVYGRVVRRQINVRPETLQIVREGMRQAVYGEHATAGVLRKFPVSAAAKTGSAEHVPGKPTHAWFVAFAPYDKPKYAVAVFVSEGGHGGQTAGPVARSILAALYGIKVEGGGNEGPSD